MGSREKGGERPSPGHNLVTHVLQPGCTLQITFSYKLSMDYYLADITRHDLVTSTQPGLGAHEALGDIETETITKRKQL